MIYHEVAKHFSASDADIRALEEVRRRREARLKQAGDDRLRRRERVREAVDRLLHIRLLDLRAEQEAHRLVSLLISAGIAGVSVATGSPADR